MSNDHVVSPSAPATVRSPASASSSTEGSRTRDIARNAEGYDAQAALLSPVQRQGRGSAAGDVHAAAAHGTRGSGGSLPYGAQIQQSFGGYDLSNVQAHTDAAASEASAAMGAEAYATGNHVAFGGAPDLHTAAHEAAHVVQQRAGVQLSGGVGMAGDPYEQHADAVADRVVQGKSAEDLLGQFASGGAGGGAVQQRAVQRSEGPPPGPVTDDQAGGEQRPEATEQTTAPDPVAEENARKEELRGVANPPLEQGPRDVPATLDPETKTVENMVSDSPDPILLKNRLLVLTSEYLALQSPEPAIKQAKLDEIKQTFEELRAAMRHARGENDALVALRVDFERLLGQKATNEWSEGVTCVDTMAATARSMIVAKETGVMTGAQEVDAKLANLAPEVKERIGAAIGAPVNVGFAGTVGTSFDAIMAALTDGSLVQKAQGLIGFTDGYLIPGLLEGAGPVFDMAQANLSSVAPELDFADLIARAKALGDPKKARALLLTSPEFAAKIAAAGASAKEANAEREKQIGGPLQAGASLGGMDTKIVDQPIEVCDEAQLDFIAGAIKSKDFPDFKLADYRTKRGRDEKCAYLIGAGVRTTKPKGLHVDATSTVEGEDGITVEQMNALEQENYAYIQGKLENIVDPKNQWIMDANAAQMPLKAGISGTSARFVGAANMLGGNINGAVVAMLGHLQAIEAHSFWEIVDAAGLGMSAGTYVPFPPNDAGMRSAADEFVGANVPKALGTNDKAEAVKVLLGERSAG